MHPANGSFQNGFPDMGGAARALRELGVQPTEVAPDPATYRELLAIVARRAGACTHYT